MLHRAFVLPVKHGRYAPFMPASKQGRDKNMFLRDERRSSIAKFCPVMCPQSRTCRIVYVLVSALQTPSLLTVLPSDAIATADVLLYQYSTTTVTHPKQWSSQLLSNLQAHAAHH